MATQKILDSFTKGRIRHRCPCQRSAGTVPVLGPFGRPPKPPQGVFNRTTAVLMLFLIYFTYRVPSYQRLKAKTPGNPSSTSPLFLNSSLT